MLFVAGLFGGGDEDVAPSAQPTTAPTAGAEPSTSSPTQTTAQPTPSAPPSATEASPAAGADCMPDTGAVAASVSQGLLDAGDSLEGGQVVHLGDDAVGGFTVVYAARIMPSGQVGLWGLGSAEGRGPIFALDDVAREATDWGVAAGEGSTADVWRLEMLASDAAVAAQACVA